MKNPFGGASSSVQEPQRAYDAEAAAPLDVKVGTAETSVRLGFLRKVYTILTINFAITVAIACAFSFIVPLRNWVVRNSWLIFIGLIVAIGAFLVLACIRPKAPLNVVFLALFVAGFSVMIGTICARYFAFGWGGVVLQAFAATLATFVGITAYIMITKKDFSYLGSFLFGALIVLIVMSLLTFVFGVVNPRLNRWLAFGISIFGALLMVGYLLYDTSLVVHRYGPDDWLIAVITLYTDVMNLFLYLLSIFSFLQG